MSKSSQIHASGDAPGAGDLVLERFVLEEVLGSGAQGAVWTARDRVTGATTAVKVIPGRAERDESFWREISALRLLSIPGVVPLLDAGPHGTAGCVAMERVDGAPFPGRDGAVAYADLAPTLRELLETLSRVHAAGIVHRDLKPANVLVDDGGHATLLDLGVAAGAALSSGRMEALAGTPRYMAPILFEGEPPSAKTDLFSFALMVVEGLTGARFRGGGSLEQLLPDRVADGAVAAALDGLAPNRVIDVLADLLERCETTEVDAESFLLAMDDARPDLRAELENTLAAVGDEGRSVAPSELEQVLLAEERVVGLRSAAARVLHESTGGERIAVVPELLRWTALGIGRVRDGRLELERLDVERLERRRGMRTLVAQRELKTTWMSTGLFGLAEAAFATLDGRLERGELREALAELPNILTTFVQLQKEDAIPAVLHRWLRVALFANDRRAIQLLLHEVQKGESTNRLDVAVVAIATAAVAAIDGAHDRAIERLTAAGADLPFELALCWHTVRVFVARQSAEAEAIATAIDDARAWADARGSAVPEIVGWEGWLAFHEGDYARAEAKHRECAASFAGLRRAQCLLDAGAAALERGDAAAVKDCAGDARAAIYGHRHTFAAARVEWLSRAGAYRAGETDAVDEELVRLIERVDAPKLAGMMLLTEAATAWRAGDLASGALLARRAERSLRDAGQSDLALLPSALAVACEAAGTTAADPPDLDRLPPAMAAQAAGLLAHRGVTISPKTRESIERFVQGTSVSDRELRREVGSLSEARAILAASD